MAFQSELPFLVFRVEGITLFGVTGRNLWLEIDEQLHNGRVRFRHKQELVHSALRDLKRKALARRAKLGREQLKRSIGWLSTIAVGGYGLSSGADWLLRPRCFGDFYYKDSECKECSYRERCKVEKLQRRQG